MEIPPAVSLSAAPPSHLMRLATYAAIASAALLVGVKTFAYFNTHSVALLSSLANIPAELVFCFATGNTARIRQLNCGLIEVGRAADFVFMDRAQHTAGKTLLESVQLGDIPGIGMVMIDGIVRCGRSRNTPPSQEIPEVISGH